MYRYSVRIARVPLALALLLALAGCGSDSTGVDDGNGGGGGNNPVVTTSVDVRNNFFEPQAIRVGQGANVTWTWNSSGVPHNVTFASPSVTNSQTMTSGTFVTGLPAAAGVYAYQCTIHAGMTGTVTVQ